MRKEDYGLGGGSLGSDCPNTDSKIDVHKMLHRAFYRYNPCVHWYSYKLVNTQLTKYSSLYFVEIWLLTCNFDQTMLLGTFIVKTLTTVISFKAISVLFIL